MKKFKDYTLEEFNDVLSKKTPVPGGGAAAALMAATGAALISMVANYSKGKGKSAGVEKRIVRILKQNEQIRRRLLALVDLDAQAYLSVVQARQASAAVKRQALGKAANVPREVCRLCYKAIESAPYLVEQGNSSLISDIGVAAEMLLAAFNAALINVEANS